MTNTFFPLHVHTDHSKLDGAGRIKDYIARTAALGLPGCSITDHGSMGGHWDFYQEAKKAGIKPVLGIEAYTAPEHRTLREKVKWGTPEQKEEDISGGGAYGHMTLFAQNVTGLRNLYRMHERSWTEGKYYKPRIDLELMSEYSEGLIATTGCPGGLTSTRLRLGQEAEALQYASNLKDIFGDRLFVEIMDHEISFEKELTPKQLDLARRLGIQPVVGLDSHCVNEEDNVVMDAFHALQSGSTINNPNRFKFSGEGFHLWTPELMQRKFGWVSDAIKSTLAIGEMVESYDDHFKFVNRMPHPIGVDPDFEDDALEEMVLAALVGRSEAYRERAIYELSVIARMQFSGYFLVLADIIGWARQQKIRVGPGRGSAGGSLVCYLVGITGIDPLLHDLPFERFLNPERVSMPDIDIDFEVKRRGEVISYAKRRFGESNVANIATLSTIKAKAAIKDAARVLDKPYSLGNAMTGCFPKPIHGFQPGLECVTDSSSTRYKDARELRALIDSDPDAQEIMSLAVGLEGLIRQTGIHPGGVVISSEPIANVIPVTLDDDGLITGFDQPSMEPLGLIKYDLLGVENLSTIETALGHIQRLYGKTVVVEDLPLDDPKTYRLLASSKTLGVFQLDGAGMRGLINRLKPSRFEDISAVLALYRPGPMGVDAHFLYADRKNGKLPVEPIHPEFAEALRPVLDNTYGVIVYQEQVMRALEVLAGYTPGQADNVRRIMGKKKPAEMAKLEPELREKLLAKGYSEEAFQLLWDTLVPFADYSFNRAHTAAYGLVAYWTAYLKANYPIAYMAALLSAEADDQDKLAEYLNDARSMGVHILPPDVNDSDYGFTPTLEGIRFGLSAIKGVGSSVISEVSRSHYGLLEDFYTNISDKVNIRALQSLIAGGAFDTFGDRGVHYDKAQVWLERAKGQRKAIEHGDIPLMRPNYSLPDTQTDKKRMRAWEKEIVGIELTLPTVTVTMERGLTETEWMWLNGVLAQFPGTQKVTFRLDGVTFSSGQGVLPSDKMIRQMAALSALSACLD